MDNIIVSMNDNVLLPQEGSNFVSPDEPVFVQENIVGGISEPCTVQVGQTKTGEPYTDALVTNVGSSQHAILNFVIPRGADGANGIDGVDGLDGESATIQVGNVTSVDYDDPATITNVGTSTHAILDFSLPRGEQGEQGLQGVAGSDGISPIAYVTQTATGATIHIEDSQNVTDANITNGTDGQDGFSPIATVTQNTGSATISITDANGTTTATVYDGTDGTNGQDGFSPIANVTQTASGATISITDAQGTTTASITNGIDGTDGTDGSDGFSPIATVTQNTGSATISITDANGTTTATVYDGTTPDTSVTTYSLSNLPTHSGGTNGYELRKQLSNVTLNLDVIWMNSVSANSWTSIGTLPSAVIPHSTITFPAVFTNGSNGQVFAYGKVNIQTNGNVRYNCPTALSSLSAISFCVSWII